MKSSSLSALLLAGIVPAMSLAQVTSAPVSGQVSFEFNSAKRNADGPYAAANALQAGVLSPPASGATLLTELRASGHGLTGSVSLQQQSGDTNADTRSTVVNELYATHDAGHWQFSVGKKVLAWDVGYGFRPNDMVQQEARLGLASHPLQGRPLLQGEYFSADSAWSLVWVNPSASDGALGSKEPALAARLYQRSGAVDRYGFARLGVRTGASVGAALAWVASDALELHSSVRYAKQIDSQAMDPNMSGLVSANPWQQGTAPDVTQWLLGGTWTNESQISLLAEFWQDGSAQSDAQWNAWLRRNDQLKAMSGSGVPAAAVAGNLAWQAQGLGISQNLRQRNVLLRLSWQHESWAPALDLLYTPADQGRAVTASLTWQGDRVKWQGGWRAYAGPADAVMAQLPSRSQAFIALNWAF